MQMGDKVENVRLNCNCMIKNHILRNSHIMRHEVTSVGYKVICARKTLTLEIVTIMRNKVPNIRN